MEAVVAYMGIFYIIDFDYPPVHELGLTSLQYICFANKEIPGDLLTTFNSALTEHMKHKDAE